MPSVPDRGRPIAGGEGEFKIGAPRSILVVVAAGIIILCLAAAGLYRGVFSALQDKIAPAHVAGAGAVVDSAPAVALPPNPDWSTLSGPQILPPPKPKAVSVAASEDEADSGAAADQASAADQAVTSANPVGEAPVKKPAPSPATPDPER
ncbi:MAG: hypothetical protein P4L64_14510 [Caulobacteraceae bacterium]|nr:hypothetical protein [Caulobacteraceae bacterium]